MDLRKLVLPIIDEMADEGIISPAMVARRAMDNLDPDHVVQTRYPKIYWLADFTLRQDSRAVLRGKYPHGTGIEREGSAKEKSHPLLIKDLDCLQRRYPQAHRSHDVDDEDDDEEAGRAYVLRELMTEEDWLWNLGQFDKAIVSRQKHRQQLKQWGMKAKGWGDPDADIGFGARERC